MSLRFLSVEAVEDVGHFSIRGESMAKFLAFILIATLVQTSVAQQATTLSKEAAAIKRKADQLSPQARISVVQFHAPEGFGSFVSNDQEGLTFYDVDRKTNITV